MRVKRMTPVLHVPEIEPCLSFWTRLGFEKTAEVPDGDRLGFVILKKDDVEIMYQSHASVAADVPPLANPAGQSSFLYIEVDDLDAIDELLGGENYVIPRRKTFYGADEVIVREPGGNVLAFAQFSAQ